MIIGWLPDRSSLSHQHSPKGEGASLSRKLQGNSEPIVRRRSPPYFSRIRTAPVVCVVNKWPCTSIFWRDNIEIAPDGRFQIENVLPEDYQLSAASKEQNIHHILSEIVPTDSNTDTLDFGEIRP